MSKQFLYRVAMQLTFLMKSTANTAANIKK